MPNSSDAFPGHVRMRPGFRAGGFEGRGLSKERQDVEKREWAVSRNPGVLPETLLMWVFSSAFLGFQQTPGHPHGAL